MNLLIGLFVLVATATADVSHLFDNSDNLQADGYHYGQPAQAFASAPQPVVDIPVALQETSFDVRSYYEPETQSSYQDLSKSYEASTQNEVAAPAPAQVSQQYYAQQAEPSAPAPQQVVYGAEKIYDRSAYEAQASAAAVPAQTQQQSYYAKPSSPVQQQSYYYQSSGPLGTTYEASVTSQTYNEVLQQSSAPSRVEQAIVSQVLPTTKPIFQNAIVSQNYQGAGSSSSSYASVSSGLAAGVLKEDGYHYETPKTPFVPAPVRPAPAPKPVPVRPKPAPVRPAQPPAPKKEYLPPPTNKPQPPVVRPVAPKPVAPRPVAPKPVVPVAPRVDYLPPKPKPAVVQPKPAPVVPKPAPVVPQREYLPPAAKPQPAPKPQPVPVRRPAPVVVPKPQPKPTNRPAPPVVRPVAPVTPEKEYLPPRPQPPAQKGYSYPNDPRPPFQF